MFLLFFMLIGFYKRIFYTVSKEARAQRSAAPFWESLLFPYSSHESKPSSFQKKINTAFMYTMNASAFALPLIRYTKLFRQKLMKKIFGHAEPLVVTSTYQFDDYSKYAMTFFDGAKRLQRRATVFVEDGQKAFLLGKKLCSG